VLLAGLALLLRLWWRTLRFHIEPGTRVLMMTPPPPSVVVLWHNRLFAAPEFFRRYFADRRLATLISASRDGAWLAGLLSRLGMVPVRGSHYKRGAQALREMLAAQRDGCDVGITPDGSRGPMYTMKPGAVAVGLKTGAPFVLLSLRHRAALRLATWDRFYLPLPFSRVDVAVDYLADPRELGSDPQVAARRLKERMDELTERCGG